MSGATKLMTAGGGGVSLTPASSIASDVTVNVPSQNCTLDIQGPAFSAYCTGTQSFANVTFTKLVFNAEEFDTANCYDSTTNYRFTPNVAGYYQVNGLFLFNNMTGGTELGLYKNGIAVKYGLYPNKVAGESVYACINTLVYMNGTTDYLELYGYQTSGGTITSIAGSTNTTYFQAFLARAA